jgi:hypothetical protein
VVRSPREAFYEGDGGVLPELHEDLALNW